MKEFEYNIRVDTHSEIDGRALARRTQIPLRSRIRTPALVLPGILPSTMSFIQDESKYQFL